MTISPFFGANTVSTTKLQNDIDNNIPASESDAASAKSVQVLASITHDANSGLYSDNGNVIVNVDNVSLDTTDSIYYFRQNFKFNFNTIKLAHSLATNIVLNDFFLLTGIAVDTEYFFIFEEISLGSGELKIVDVEPLFNEKDKILISRFFFRKSLGVNGEIDPLTYSFQPKLIASSDFIRSGLPDAFHRGLDTTPRSGELRFDISAGIRYSESLNYKNDRQNPHIDEYIAQTPMKFTVISPAEKSLPTLPIINDLVDPAVMSVGTSLQALPTNHWGIHLIFKTRLGNLGIIRPQETYGANNAPISNDSLSYEPDLSGLPSGSMFIAAWAIKKESIDLNDVSTAFQTDLPRVLTTLH